MKKIFYIIFAIPIFFLFNNNVFAFESNSTATYYYDSNYVNNYTLTDSTKNFIDNDLISYLDENFSSSYDYIISADGFLNMFSTDTSIISPQLYVIFLPIENNCSYRYQSLGIKNSSSSYLYYGRISCSSSISPTSDGDFKQFNYKKIAVNNIRQDFDLNYSINAINNNLSNFTLGNSYIPDNIYCSSSNCGIDINWDLFTDVNPNINNGRYDLIYYSTSNLIITDRFVDDSYTDSFIPFKVYYDGNFINNDQFYQYDDIFPTYKNANQNFVDVDKIEDLGNNTYGIYSNYINLNLTSLSGPADTLSILCEEQRPFENEYCNMYYNDLILKNNNISSFNNYGLSFTKIFGNNTTLLNNNRYYLLNFRIQKPFVPSVGNIFINSLTNNPNKVNILNVYLRDSGSYTDYIVKFKIENSNYNESTNFNDFMVVFRDGLGTYYNNNIPNSFVFGVYRSFKLQYFNNEPTNNDINNFISKDDLTDINGKNNQYSFFTDNQFNSFGFSGIITAPFRFLYALKNYESCSPITVPFPHSNENITLYCVQDSIPNSVSPLIVILQTILTGFICYRIAIGVLKTIKELTSPNDSEIEVMDL